MKRPASLPVLVQVAALAALAVVMSQVVAFAVVLLAPDPRPRGFTIASAAEALKGLPAETADGRTLKRKIADAPLHRSRDRGPDTFARAISVGLARRLGVAPEAVQVVIDHDRPQRLRSTPTPTRLRADTFVFRSEASPAAHGDASPTVIMRGGEGIQGRWGVAPTRPLAEDLAATLSDRRFMVVMDQLTITPFAASLRLDDGRWATIEPPRDLLSPWQQQITLALLISMLLLAPVVWLLARRLTRPIRVFAEAAERLGADPEAPPLSPSGPSEVRTAIVAFNEMQASLRDHIRRRTQTVAAIAHDLRTPLTRLRFRAEQAPDTVRDRMAADIEEMDELIAQAMAYVRGETSPERREPMDLAVLAQACALGFSETGADVRFEGERSLTMLGDSAALRRALANLIGNAVQYGGGVRVTAIHAGNHAIIHVEDDGPGLPEDQLQSVFEPFHRAERSRSRETGGAGLGLTVARQVARAHGGDVTLTNRRGGGLVAKLQVLLSPHSQGAADHVAPGPTSRRTD